MSVRRPYELPPAVERLRRRAVRLEWITLAIVVINVVVLSLTVGQSQAMRTALVEDLLALVPPIGFLIATHFEDRTPDAEHPYGYVRTISIAFVAAAFALLVFGGYMFYRAAVTLVGGTHPTIGTVVVFGEPVWLGWLMVGALVYTGIPPMVVGRIKLPIARDLHDKALAADASMNRADWLTSISGLVGVVGVGLGHWWLDAVAAMVIAADIVRDGIKHLARSVQDLMDVTPRTVFGNEPDPLMQRVRGELAGVDWIQDVAVRMREEGHVYTGEAFVVPHGGLGADELVRRMEAAIRRIEALDWRIYDFSIVPVATLEPER